MAKYRLLAVTNAVAGQDQELNSWYDSRHVPDVLSVPGVVSAQRFRVPAGLEGPFTWRYLTLYELDTLDVNAVLQELGVRFGTPVMPATDALDRASAGAVILEEIGDVVRRG